MNTKPIEDQFLRMGVRLKVTTPAQDRRRWWIKQSEYSLDVQRDRKGEHYVLSVPEEREADLEVGLLQNCPKERHLLLMVRDQEKTIDRFLCGHDEREWFVAAVPGAIPSSDAGRPVRPPAESGSARRRRRHRSPGLPVGCPC